jgi:protein arginine kinase activator
VLCQNCGRSDALIHLTEISDGKIHSLWLCTKCARKHKNAQNQDDRDEDALFGDIPRRPPPSRRSEGDSGLAEFLGEDGILQRNLDPDGVHTCPVCGHTIEEYFRTSRLGCPACYQAFDPNIRPMLARHHGRTIHLGKVPRSSTDSASSLAELTRTRIALDRAVAEEDFEEAARLRDQLKELQRLRRREDGHG